jgi:hypothetical protein
MINALIIAGLVTVVESAVFAVSFAVIGGVFDRAWKQLRWNMIEFTSPYDPCRCTHPRLVHNENWALRVWLPEFRRDGILILNPLAAMVREEWRR